jgi:hypothetical protein
MSTLAAAALPNTTPVVTFAFVANSDPAILARPDCTPMPTRVTSTTTTASEPLTHRVRSRASLRFCSSCV